MIRIGAATQRFTDTSLPSAMQAVALDSTHYYVVLTGELRKYRLSDNGLEWTVDTLADAPEWGTQSNGAHIRDGLIYIGLLNGGGGLGAGIQVRQTSDGSFVRNHVLSTDATFEGCEGGAFRPGTDRFFAVDNRNDKLREMDGTDPESWSFVADYDPYNDNGANVWGNDTRPSGGGGQSVVWIELGGEQYALLNRHDNNPSHYNVCDVFRWTGTGFEFVGRLRQPREATGGLVAGQGQALTADQSVLWWAGRRNGVPTNGAIVSTPITLYQPNNNAWPDRVRAMFGSNLRVFLRMDEATTAHNQVLANLGNGPTVTLTQEASGRLPIPRMIPRYSSTNWGMFFEANPEVSGCYLACSGSPITFALNQPWTFACWAVKEYVTNSANRGCLYSATGSDDVPYLQIRESATEGKLAVNLRNDDNTNLVAATSTGTPFALQTPVHVIVTFDGAGACRIYLNGVLDSTHNFTPSGTVTLTAEAFAKSLPFAAHRYWRGELDEIIIAQQVVTDNDAAALYAAAMTQMQPGTLTASNITADSATLTWTAASGNVGSVTTQLQRSTDGVAWSNVSGATTSPATDSTLTPATTYYYRVAFTDSDLATVYSEAVEVVTPGTFRRHAFGAAFTGVFGAASRSHSFGSSWRGVPS